jgi:hypothetical protein
MWQAVLENEKVFEGHFKMTLLKWHFLRELMYVLQKINKCQNHKMDGESAKIFFWI